jgi:hypothetical protein
MQMDNSIIIYVSIYLLLVLNINSTFGKILTRFYNFYPLDREVSIILIPRIANHNSAIHMMMSFVLYKSLKSLFVTSMQI